MSELIVKINSAAYSGFESVHIRTSMLNIAGGFALSSDNFFNGLNSINPSATAGIKMAAMIQLEINKDIIINGWIDKMPIKYGPDYDRLEIYGRDSTGDLVDCSYPGAPNEWKQQTLSSLITNLCLPFGIKVVVDPTASTEAAKPIETYKTSEGVPVSEQIASLCREAGVVPMADGLRGLLLTKVPTVVSSESLIVGKNVVSGELKQSNVDRYNSVTVKGYGIDTDTKILTDYIGCVGTFVDPIVKRPRPLVIFSEELTNIDRCGKRAIYEARVRAALSRAVTYKIHSWTKDDFLPWKINTLVQVSDDFLGIKDTRLILAIDYIYDSEDGGDVAYITVVDKDIFSLSQNAITTATRFDA